jgi:ribonuclease-3
MAHPKSTLNERAKQLSLPKPTFETERHGPEHEPTFRSRVFVGERLLGEGEAKTKREAEKLASQAALQTLERPNTQAQALDNEAFDGPWPVFPEVLAASLHVANSRVAAKRLGEEALDDVKALALKLYKDSLLALGDVVEVDEE